MLGDRLARGELESASEKIWLSAYNLAEDLLKFLEVAVGYGLAARAIALVEAELQSQA